MLILYHDLWWSQNTQKGDVRGVTDCSWHDLLRAAPEGVTNIAMSYCTQLEKLNESYAQEEWGGAEVCFLHENAKPHIVKMMQIIFAIVKKYSA